VAEVAPLDGDVVIAKNGPSGFHDTPLDTVLRQRGVDTVLVCGEATSGCVRSTVVDACSRGYRVGVLGDCCFDRFEASHWVSLFDLDQKYGDVVSADDTIRYLKGLPS
jgi:nicotinamidase-related amidase